MNIIMRYGRIPGKIFVLLFISTLFVMGCSESGSPAENENDGISPSITSKYYFEAKIDGKSVIMQTYAGGVSTRPMSFGIEPNWEGYTIQQGFEFLQHKWVHHRTEIDYSKGYINIVWAKKFAEKPALDYEFDSVIQKGSVSFADNDKRIEGVSIVYIDSNGRTWLSRHKGGDQAGSSFTVTEHSRITGQVSELDPHFETKGRFSCKLYNVDGSFITVTDAKFSAKTIIYRR